jgi:WD40 repeat protein
MRMSVACAFASACLLAPVVATNATAQIRRISVGLSGTEPNDDCRLGNRVDVNRVVDDSGRWVVFASRASNLVSNDSGGTITDPCTNQTVHVMHVYVHDCQTGLTGLVSQSSSGVVGNNDSTRPAISPDGRWVVFQSQASNLIASDGNAWQDIFVRDLGVGGTTVRVSVSSSGGDPDGASAVASISSNGRYVAFESVATNLITNPPMTTDSNGKRDVFLVDRNKDNDAVFDESGDFDTTRVSVKTDGSESASGSRTASIHRTGRYVVFQTVGSLNSSSDTDVLDDVYAYDRNATGSKIRLLDVSSSNGKADFGATQAYIDGVYVPFQGAQTNWTEFPATSHATLIYVRDQSAPTGVAFVSVKDDKNPPNSACFEPTISQDGRWVAFYSAATDLISGTDTNHGPDPFTTSGSCPITGNDISGYDVFLHDRDADGDGVDDSGTVHNVLVSHAAGSLTTAANNHSIYPSITGDGRYVVFESIASDIVSGDSAGHWDVFMFDRQNP